MKTIKLFNYISVSDCGKYCNESKDEHCPFYIVETPSESNIFANGRCPLYGFLKPVEDKSIRPYGCEYAEEKMEEFIRHIKTCHEAKLFREGKLKK